MKNKLITLSIIALSISPVLLGFTQIASADVECGTLSGYTCGNGSPESVIGGWGTTNSDVPHLSQGQVATDDNGVHSTCQWMSGCVDIYHTTWYQNLIQSLRAQLGDANFQIWVNLQK